MSELPRGKISEKQEEWLGLLEAAEDYYKECWMIGMLSKSVGGDKDWNEQQLAAFIRKESIIVFTEK